jgi:hypothetical protein
VGESVKITEFLYGEEFFAPFIHVQGKRGTILIFSSEDPVEAQTDLELAKEIGKVLDREA